jgi:putative spermidine/putrescine transport system permease protein
VSRLRTSRALGALAILLPGLLVLLLFFALPLVGMFDISLRGFAGPGQVTATLSASNYLQFLADPYYRAVLLRTLGIGLAVTLLCLLLGYPYAYTLVRSSRRVAALLTVLALVPLMTSVIVRTYGWMLLLGKSGPLAALLAALGLPPLEAMYTVGGTIVALAQVLLPFMVLSLATAIQQIRPELEDSVRSLGGGALQVAKDVLIPLSLPGMAAGSILVFTLSISAFATPLLIGGVRTKVVATVVYEQAITLLNWPTASAGAFVLMLIAVLLAWLQARIIRWRTQWTR